MTIRKNSIGELDWGGIISSALNTAGQVYQTSVQQKAMQQTGAYSGYSPQSSYGSGYMPQQYAPQQGQLIPGVSNILLLGGAGVVAFLLLRKGRR